MSIVILGMEMPKSCSDCRLFSDAWCLALGYDWRKAYNRPPDGERLDDCPLIPLPEGHGRLIDADALIDALETQDYSCAPDTLEDWTPQDMTAAEIADITHAPTIVPAEGGPDDGN